ncbi:hypothetical protein CYLTODRAFT_211462 [Cylindrobasidium torrendii FP15055 ss-10]|uniref:Uncharacterized protein n=1 Tax=Cylindrobasidium torrendii FP15055 ss-10 TaxID=1314674 RepID=A0A0D7BH44_9AGAR|nr:hypothetical protein CYLTODRAFT_211462 [Cylindrobasidium torrendii FP15055 ss-10]
MDSSYDRKKVADLSEEELLSLGYIGENVPSNITAMVEQIRADPTHFGRVTCSQMDWIIREESRQSEPAPPPLSDAELVSSLFSNDPDAFSVVGPDMISKYEKRFWYHGISRNPPDLLWRSDLETNPFPIPSAGDLSFKIPVKEIHPGMFGTRLQAVWSTVAPQIIGSIKAHGIQLTTLQTVRFSTTTFEGDTEKETMRPAVIWITVKPDTTNAQAVCDATPDIMRILSDVQITDVVVEWYEGAVERLLG